MAFMAMLTEGIQQKKGTGCRWWWDMYMIANVIINWIKQKKTESKNNKVKCNVMIAQAIFVNEWMNEWNSMTKMIKIFFLTSSIDDDLDDYYFWEEKESKKRKKKF